MKNFKLLFDIIPPHPGQNIAIIEDSQDNFLLSLKEFSQKIDATLHVKALGEREPINTEILKIKTFSFKQSRYNTFSVEYDFLFLCVDISEREDIKTICKKLYRVMKNAGYLFLFVKKDEVERYFELLEDTNYVALNNIEFNEKLDVVVAKKMHGWRKV